MLSLVLTLAMLQWEDAPTWPFQPAPDDFRSDALLDLRDLNEKVAGQNGFVRVGPDGQFLLGDGKPARFWCVGTGVGREKNFQPRPLGRQTAPDLARHARFLAKRGVNMIRLHTQVSPSPSQNPDSVNQDERDWIWRAVAAMKKEGIYTTWSPYWCVPMKFGPTWNYEGGAPGNAFGMLFFDPKLQTAYKSWLKSVLSEKNPYTGIALANDPALAIIQLQNEDSLLFWTFNAIQGEPKQLLLRQYSDFLAKKYGSVDKALATWEASSVDFLNIWELTQVRTGSAGIHVADQAAFLTETMRKFNQSMVDFLRKELGCKQLVNAGNWRTADAVRMNDLERYSYTPTDVDAVNRYYGGVHKGPNEGWAIMKGDKFTSPSVLVDPGAFPLNLKQTEGRPILVTESSWTMPAGYASEGPFLVSAYQSLTGSGGYYWFATGDDEWTPPQSANGYQPSLAKWTMATPDTMGAFPAAALMYRKGYVKRGKPVVREERGIDDLWNRRAPLIAETDGFDPNRDMKDVARNAPVKTPIDQRAFLVGPVVVHFGGSVEDSLVTDLSKYIKGSAIRSNTGELELDTARRRCTVDTPCAQGVAAFFESGTSVDLRDVSFRSGNDYGSALAVSMDSAPIASSHRILVQFVTKARPTGWKEKPTKIDLGEGKSGPGFEVVDFGKAPWQVVSARLKVTVRNPGLTSASVLDANGNVVKKLTLERTANAVSFTFPEDALYVVLR